MTNLSKNATAVNNHLTPSVILGASILARVLKTRRATLLRWLLWMAIEEAKSGGARWITAHPRRVAGDFAGPLGPVVNGCPAPTVRHGMTEVTLARLRRQFLELAAVVSADGKKMALRRDRRSFHAFDLAVAERLLALNNCGLRAALATAPLLRYAADVKAKIAADDKARAAGELEGVRLSGSRRAELAKRARLRGEEVVVTSRRARAYSGQSGAGYCRGIRTVRIAGLLTDNAPGARVEPMADPDGVTRTRHPARLIGLTSAIVPLGRGEIRTLVAGALQAGDHKPDTSNPTRCYASTRNELGPGPASSRQGPLEAGEHCGASPATTPAATPPASDPADRILGDSLKLTPTRAHRVCREIFGQGSPAEASARALGMIARACVTVGVLRRILRREVSSPDWAAVERPYQWLGRVLENNREAIRRGTWGGSLRVTMPIAVAKAAAEADDAAAAAAVKVEEARRPLRGAARRQLVLAAAAADPATRIHHVELALSLALRAQDPALQNECAGAMGCAAEAWRVARGGYHGAAENNQRQADGRWKNAAEALQRIATPAEWRQELAPLVARLKRDGTGRILAPDSAAAEWASERWGVRIHAALAEATGRPWRLTFATYAGQVVRVTAEDRAEHAAFAARVLRPKPAAAVATVNGYTAGVGGAVIADRDGVCVEAAPESGAASWSTSSGATTPTTGSSGREAALAWARAAKAKTQGGVRRGL